MGTKGMAGWRLVTVVGLVLAVAFASPGAECDGDLECLKRAHDVLMAQLEAETYKNQNLTQKHESTGTQVAKLQADLKTKTEMHARLQSEITKHEETAAVLRQSLKEAQKVESLKRDTEQRKAETQEALDRLTLVKKELEVRGKDAGADANAKAKELDEAMADAKAAEEESKPVPAKKVATKKQKPCCELPEEGAAFLELNAQLEAAGVCTQCQK